MAEPTPAHQITCDAAGRALAERVEYLLAEAGLGVTLTMREHFPVADAMTQFLQHLNAQAVAPVLVISASPEASRWIWRELQAGAPLYSRIAVVVARDAQDLLGGAQASDSCLAELDLTAAKLVALLRRVT